jgi:hypothetical protein
VLDITTKAAIIHDYHQQYGISMVPAALLAYILFYIHHGPPASKHYYLIGCAGRRLSPVACRLSPAPLKK